MQRNPQSATYPQNVPFYCFRRVRKKNWSRESETNTKIQLKRHFKENEWILRLSLQVSFVGWDFDRRDCNKL